MHLFVGLFLTLATGGCLATYPSMSSANSYGGMAQQHGMKYVEEPPKPYQYNYEVDDGYNNRQHHNEESDAYGAKKGSYGYTDAHGVYRTVDYVADKDGYRAYVKSNEPGVGPEAPADAVLHVKPVPDAVQAQAIMATYQPRMQALSMNEYHQTNMGGESIKMLPMALPMKMLYQPKMAIPMMDQISYMKIIPKPKMMMLMKMPILSAMAQKMRNIYQKKMMIQAAPMMPSYYSMMDSSMNPEIGPMDMAGSPVTLGYPISTMISSSKAQNAMQSAMMFPSSLKMKY